jgi:hypothetical protein
VPVSARWLSAKARLPGTAVITHDQSCGQQCRSSSATPVCRSGTLRVLYGYSTGCSTGSCGRSLLKQKAAVSVVDRVLSCDAKSRLIDCAYVMQTLMG